MNPKASQTRGKTGQPATATVEQAAAALYLWRQRCRQAPLLRLVALLTPGFSPPERLRPVADLFEGSCSGEVRGLVSVPRQHGKTELIKAAFVWLMLRRPGLSHSYVTYEAGRATEISRKLRRLLHSVGVRTEGSATYWRTPDGSEFYASGISGPLTGRGVSGLLVVDDPHKNREDVESRIMREKVIGGWRAVGISGVHPGASAVVVHSRWHPEDLIGTLEKEHFAPFLNLPAIRDDGTALWPEKYGLPELTKIRREMGEYEWGSLMMGSPRPKGATVFTAPTYFDELPARYRVAVGVDFAYSSKTSSDYSVAVVLAYAPETECYYVLQVLRRQCDPSAFCEELRALRAGYPGARWLWYASTTETGLAATLRNELGFPLISRLAKRDKFIRAQPVSGAWRAGTVLVPRGAPWAQDFTAEVCSFTGVGDRHDDQVDALAAAFDQLDASNVIPMPRAFGTRFGVLAPDGSSGQPPRPEAGWNDPTYDDRVSAASVRKTAAFQW